MRAVIRPSHLEGTVKTVASKSQAHRMLICAAFADKPTDIICRELSQDIEATAKCLIEMGSSISYDRETGSFHVVPVGYRCEVNTSKTGCTDSVAAETAENADGKTDACGSESITIDVGESGSTLRFLLPVVCALGIDTHIVMHGRLSERPLSPLWEELEAHGAVLRKNNDSTMDVSGVLTGNRYKLAADVSSQFISGLMFAAPLIREKEGDFELELTGNVESVNYILMTVDALKSFGVRVEERDGRLVIPQGASYISPERLEVEGDWSNGAFWICASVMTGGSIKAAGLNRYSVQGDSTAADLALKISGRVPVIIDSDGTINVRLDAEGNAYETAAASGAHDTEGTGTGHTAESAVSNTGAGGSGCSVTINEEIPSRLNDGRPCIVDARNVPDLVPVLSVLASSVEGETVFTHAERLRIKESDRIKATVTMLKALGADAEETADGIRVRGTGKGLAGGVVDSCNDHRIAMSAAIASIICKNDVTVLNAQAVRKSYPDFWKEFAKLGADVTLTED